MQDDLQHKPDDHKRNEYRIYEINDVNQWSPLEVGFVVRYPAIWKALGRSRMAFPASPDEVRLNDGGIRPLRPCDIVYTVTVCADSNMSDSVFLLFIIRNCDPMEIFQIRLKNGC